MLKFKQLTALYFLILAILCFSNVCNEFLTVLAIVCITLGYILIVTIGVIQIDSQMFVKTYCSNYSATGKVAITFDDGPDAKYTPEILHLLSKYDSKATFFCIGFKLENNRSITEQIIAEGHLIGNHSYTHSNMFPLFSPTKIAAEISKTQKTIKSITNKDNIYFRPPFGVTNPLLQKALSKFNLVTVGWSIRSLDSKNEASAIVVRRITKKIKSGDIILLHDTSSNILAILEELLQFLKDKNLKPVTVNELL